MNRSFICGVISILLMFATIGKTSIAYAQFSEFLAKLSNGKEELFGNLGSNDNDALYMDRALQRLLDNGVSRAKAEWLNPKNNRHGKIELIAPVKDFMDRPCWKFSQTKVLKKQKSKNFGLVCNMSEDTDDSIVADWVITRMNPASQK